MFTINDNNEIHFRLKRLPYNKYVDAICAETSYTKESFGCSNEQIEKHFGKFLNFWLHYNTATNEITVNSATGSVEAFITNPRNVFIRDGNFALSIAVFSKNSRKKIIEASEFLRKNYKKISRVKQIEKVFLV